MKKTIKINLDDLSSFDKAIKEIDAYEKWVNKKTNELIMKLAQKGAKFAQENVKRYSGDSKLNNALDTNTDAQYEPVMVSDGIWKIIASGEDIYFIEFGAGYGVDTDNPFVEQANVEVSIGSYSREHEGMFEKTGYKYWFWGGHSVNYVLALRPMYNTQKELEERLIIETAREVFGSD